MPQWKHWNGTTRISALIFQVMTPDWRSIVTTKVSTCSSDSRSRIKAFSRCPGLRPSPIDPLQVIGRNGPVPKIRTNYTGKRRFRRRTSRISKRDRADDIEAAVNRKEKVKLPRRQLQQFTICHTSLPYEFADAAA